MQMHTAIPNAHIEHRSNYMAGALAGFSTWHSKAAAVRDAEEEGGAQQEEAAVVVEAFEAAAELVRTASRPPAAM